MTYEEGRQGQELMAVSDQQVSFSGSAVFYQSGSTTSVVHLIGKNQQMQEADWSWSQSRWLEQNGFALFRNSDDLSGGLMDVGGVEHISLSGDDIGTVLVPVPGTSDNNWSTWGDNCAYGYNMFWLGGVDE